MFCKSFIYVLSVASIKRKAMQEDISPLPIGLRNANRIRDRDRNRSNGAKCSYCWRRGSSQLLVFSNVS